MKKIIYMMILAFCFLNGGNVFSQENDKVCLVIKTVYENDGFFGLGFDLGSLKDRKIEVFGEGWNLVVVDKLTGSGETVEISNWSKPGEVILANTNEVVVFKTVNKKIVIQEMGGGRDEIDLFDKIMASEHHTYNLNSIVTSQVKVKSLGGVQDSSMVEILEWLVKNNEIYNFPNEMDDEVKIYKHVDAKGNTCILFYNQRTFTGPGNKPSTGGTFFYLEKPEDKSLRRLINKIKLNITADDNSFEIFKGTDSGPDEVIPNEKMLNGLIKETFKDKYSNFLVKKSFSVKAVVTKDVKSF